MATAAKEPVEKPPAEEAAVKHFTAKISFARIAPRKCRYVVDLVRGQSVNRALDILKVVPNRGAYYLNKVLRSALANAANRDEDVDADTLWVSRAEVGPGPVIKRWQPAPMGRACKILKRTSHIFVTLSTPVGGEEAGPKRRGKKGEGAKKPAAAGTQAGAAAPAGAAPTAGAPPAAPAAQPAPTGGTTPPAAGAPAKDDKGSAPKAS
ncbi:MAG: 50S ribosomal protein L22 [Planctomycetes bacterium]|nr:50S ribosomal protein L22 [Planctomycetota bacterium]